MSDDSPAKPPKCLPDQKALCCFEISSFELQNGFTLKAGESLDKLIYELDNTTDNAFDLLQNILEKLSRAIANWEPVICVTVNGGNIIADKTPAAHSAAASIAKAPKEETKEKVTSIEVSRTVVTKVVKTEVPVEAEAPKAKPATTRGKSKKKK